MENKQPKPATVELEGKASSKGRGKRKFRKSTSEFEKKVPFKKQCGWNNDPAWYSKFPELLQGVTNVANNSLPGVTRFAPTEMKSLTPFGQLAGLSMPVVFTPGKCLQPTDAFNMQMKSLWLELHRRYRGIGTYEYSDLAIAIFCIAQIYAFIAEGERAYGIALNYQARNRHIPNGLEVIIHWDFQSLNSDLANFRYNLNRIITKARVLCLPKGFPMLEDVTQLFSNVFKDRPSVKSQFFAYYNHVTWMYDATTLSTGGAALGSPHVNYWTSSSYLLRLESLVDALVGDDDIARICSDILAAYADSELFDLKLMPEDYRLEPMYDEFRALQMHNLSSVEDIKAAKTVNVTATWPSNTDLVVYQDRGNVVSLFSGAVGQAISTYYAPNPGAAIYYAGYTSGTTQQRTGQVVGFACDTWHDNFSPDEIAEITRFHITANREEVIDTGSTHEYITYIVHGPYIPMNPILVILEYDGSNKRSDYTTMSDDFTILLNATFSSSRLTTLLCMSQVDNAPLFYLYDNDALILAGDNLYVIGDVDNLIYITPGDLQEIHNVCTLSEWSFTNTIIK